MKIIIQLFLILFFFQSSIGQSSFEKVDAYVRNTNFSSKEINQLTTDITSPFETELEKARAIFVWITDNIKYDCKQFHKPKNTKITYGSEKERIAKRQKMRETAVLRTLRYKKGICQDYAALFKKMCGIVGIESEIISGFGRQNRNDIGKIPKSSNHAWNSVKIDDQWFLLDVTWASGGTNPEVTKFHKKFKEGYFLTPPSDFIKNHYPTKDEFQFLESPLSKEDFSKIPFIGYGYYEAGVQEYSPKNAILSSRNKTTNFKLKLDKEIQPNQLIILLNNKKQEVDIRTENGYILFNLKKFRKSNKKVTIGFFDSTKNYHSILTYKVK